MKNQTDMKPSIPPDIKLSDFKRQLVKIAVFLLISVYFFYDKVLHGGFISLIWGWFILLLYLFSYCAFEGAIYLSALYGKRAYLEDLQIEKTRGEIPVYPILYYSGGKGAVRFLALIFGKKGQIAFALCSIVFVVYMNP